jgi:hypothetical protein
MLSKLFRKNHINLLFNFKNVGLFSQDAKKNIFSSNKKENNNKKV